MEVALGIASYTYGGLLGVFLIGMIDKKTKQIDAIIGFVTALIVMTLVIATLKIAWPLYTVVGATTVIIVGIISSKITVSTESESNGMTE